MLTEIRDPQGNTLTFTYDASGRLTGITGSHKGQAFYSIGLTECY
jgi:YD repeat-containing protein